MNYGKVITKHCSRQKLIQLFLPAKGIATILGWLCKLSLYKHCCLISVPVDISNFHSVERRQKEILLSNINMMVTCMDANNTVQNNCNAQSGCPLMFNKDNARPSEKNPQRSLLVLMIELALLLLRAMLLALAVKLRLGCGLVHIPEPIITFNLVFRFWRDALKRASVNL